MFANPGQTIQVDLQPIGRRAQIAAGETLLGAAQSAGVELVAVCGGGGTCGTCRVRLASGDLSPVTSNEAFELSAGDLAAGYRLACQAMPLSDVKLDIPPTSLTALQRVQIEGREIDIAIDPVVWPVNVTLAEPDLRDVRSDVTRLKEALRQSGHPIASIDHAALIDLSDRLRAQHWSARLAVRGDRVVAALSPQSALIGLAVDVGTTKLAAYLVDLETGKTLARLGALNPQIAYGEDVISRIAYADARADGRRILHDKLVDGLNRMIGEMCAEIGAAREQVVEAVVVGNTAMHHLFADLPVHQLGVSPYVPAINDALEARARDVGLAIAPGAWVYLPPTIAGYVGADHVAMLLATEAWQTQDTLIALDIGTNTEISLAHRGRLWCCSCASGPAFEGAHIRDGMRAAPGAIERVQIVDGQARAHTIGGQPPIGICGSGILDAIAAMLSDGILNGRGALRKDDPRVRMVDGESEFVIAPTALTGHGRDVVVTRGDVTEIQLAKGAIRAGIDVLLHEGGLTYADLDAFIVAGAFGTYLDVDSAVRVGLFPDLPRERFRQVGNAAGAGARQLLVSAERRRAASEIARRITYVELTTVPGFAQRFAAALRF